MLDIEKYGIKEVADVTFYKIKPNGDIGAPVLFLDTLKISNIESSAEVVTAKGGEGNSNLFTWEFGREITLKIEDALFSPRSLAIMYGTNLQTNEETELIITKTINIDRV